MGSSDLASPAIKYGIPCWSLYLLIYDFQRIILKTPIKKPRGIDTFKCQKEKSLDCVFHTLKKSTSRKYDYAHSIKVLVQDCSISSASAMEILQSCTKPSVCTWLCSVVVWFRGQSGLLLWYWGNHLIAPVPEKQPWRIWINYSNKQRVLMHRHQGWNVRHGLCHIYMRYLYIYMSCL